MTELERKQVQALDAQIALQLKQARTEFPKLWLAALAASAVVFTAFGATIARLFG